MLIESVGGNAEASRLAGVRSRNLIILAYVFSGLCAGIAGLMLSSGIKGADGNNAGLWFELDAILAVVIGGTALAGGRYFLAGTLVGAILIQTLATTIYSIGIPPETTLLFKALVVTIVCLMQSPAFRAKVFRQRRGETPARRGRRGRRRTAAGAARRGARMSTPQRPRRLRTSGCSARSEDPDQVRAGPGDPRAARDDVRLRLAPVPELRLGPGVPQPLHRQRVPARGRGRDDVRDPHRRHRPLGRLGGRALDAALRGACLRTAGRRCLAFLAVLLVGSTLGLAMGCVIHYFEIQPFIVTLAGMFLARGLCYAITVDAISITNPTYVSVAAALVHAARRALHHDRA